MPNGRAVRRGRRITTYSCRRRRSADMVVSRAREPQRAVFRRRDDRRTTTSANPVNGDESRHRAQSGRRAPGVDLGHPQRCVRPRSDVVRCRRVRRYLDFRHARSRDSTSEVTSSIAWHRAAKVTSAHENPGRIRSGAPASTTSSVTGTRAASSISARGVLIRAIRQQFSRQSRKGRNLIGMATRKARSSGLPGTGRRVAQYTRRPSRE